MEIDWENVLCEHIEDNESYYECLSRLIKEHGTRKRVAKFLGINFRQIQNLFYSVKNETQTGERTKGVFNHTEKFVSDIHRWLTANDVKITKKELQIFLQTDEGQGLIRAKLALLEGGL